MGLLSPGIGWAKQVFQSQIIPARGILVKVFFIILCEGIFMAPLLSKTFEKHDGWVGRADGRKMSGQSE
jgi:hypothetical protein